LHLLLLDTEEHAALIKVAQQASEDNLSKAELVDNIKALGAVAVKIAKKILSSQRCSKAKTFKKRSF
jgi:hypothetical protein